MPASKPAFDAALSNDAINNGSVFCSWCVEDPANPTRLTNVVSGQPHATLVGVILTEIVVTGGTGGNAAYNQTYSPSGTYGGKPCYVSADNNYWCVFDEWMYSAWVLMIANGDPMMDAIAYNNDASAPTAGSWSASFAVAEGNPASDPWTADGIDLGGGYADVDGSHVYGQSGGMTIMLLVKWAGGTGWRGAAGADGQKENGTGLYYLQFRSDSSGKAEFRWYGTGSHWGDTTQLSTAFPANAYHLLTGTVDADYVRIYLDDDLIQQVARTRDFISVANLHTIIGGSWGSAPNDLTDCEVAMARAWNRGLSTTEVATIAADPYALAEQESTETLVSPGEGLGVGVGEATITAVADTEIAAGGTAGGTGDAGLEQETQVAPGEGTAGGLGSATLTQTAQVNLVYPTFRQALWEGTAGNVLTGTVKAVLVDATKYGREDTDEFLSAVPAAARIVTSPALSGKSITAGVFDADDVRTGVLVTGATADLCLTYLDTGSEATSRLISYARGVGYVPAGGAPEIRWSASGIWSLLVPGSETSVMYPLFVAELLAQTLGDLSSVDFYAVLVNTTSYTYSAAHNFLDDVPAGARVATSRVLANVDFTSGALRADNARFDKVADEAVADAMVVYADGANDGARRLVGYMEGFTFTGTGLPALVAWGADGVAALREWEE